MLTFWADSLIDHDEKPGELNVLSHGQCDLWDNHQGCLEQKAYLCTHSLSVTQSQHVLHPAKREFPLPVQKRGLWLENGGGWGLTISF